jgi:hypothetical protein
VTTAPGTIAPVESVTTPLIEPDPPSCACTATPNAKQVPSRNTTVRNTLAHTSLLPTIRLGDISGRDDVAAIRLGPICPFKKFSVIRIWLSLSLVQNELQALVGKSTYRPIAFLKTAKIHKWSNLLLSIREFIGIVSLGKQN